MTRSGIGLTADLLDIDLLLRKTLARALQDDREDSAHATLLDAAISSSSLVFARPLVIACRASDIPSRIDGASPATYSAAPALSATISCAAPRLPVRIDCAIAAFVFESPPAISSIGRSSSGKNSY